MANITGILDTAVENSGKVLKLGNDFVQGAAQYKTAQDILSGKVNSYSSPGVQVSGSSTPIFLIVAAFVFVLLLRKK